MTIFGFNHNSLKRHGVSLRDCLEVLADDLRLEADHGESRQGNSTIMWVGTTMVGSLLEVGVEYMDGMDWIFHANTARSHYRDLYKTIRRL